MKLVKTIFPDPPVITLFKTGDMWQSSTFISGATVTTSQAGKGILVFEVPEESRLLFSNGSRHQEQRTSQTIPANEEFDMTMSWQVRGPRTDLEKIDFKIRVELDGDPSSFDQKNIVTTVKYAGMFMNMLKKMLPF